MKITRQQLRGLILESLFSGDINEDVSKDRIESAQKLFDRLVEEGFEKIDLSDSLEDIKVIKKIKKVKGGLELAKEKYDKVIKVVNAVNKLTNLKGKSREQINLAILNEIENSDLIDNALDKGEDALDQFFFTIAFSAIPGAGVLATKVIKMVSGAASSALREFFEEKIDQALALVFLKNTLNDIKPGFYELLFKSDVSDMYATKQVQTESIGLVRLTKLQLQNIIRKSL